MSYIIPIIIVFFNCIFGAIAASLLKAGSKKGILSKNIILGIIIYGLSAIVFVVALKYAPVSILYPITASTYIWSFLIARFHFREKITAKKILGLALIIIGIALLAVI